MTRFALRMRERSKKECISHKQCFFLRFSAIQSKYLPKFWAELDRKIAGQDFAQIRVYLQGFCLILAHLAQACFLDIRSKTQGEKTIKLKTHEFFAQNSKFRQFFQ